MTKTSKVLFLLLFGFLLWPASALAFTAKAGDSINLAKGEVIDGNLYLAGANINIEGKVTGDVICAGQTVNITGTVLGDVICVGQTINIGGQIIGNLRAVGTSINLTGQVNKNATLGAASINTSASSSVGWEMLFGSSVAELKGNVGYDLAGWSNTVALSGNVGKDVKLKLDNRRGSAPGLHILSGATVGGKLTYTDKLDAQIDQGSKITGEVLRNEAKFKQANNKELFFAWLWERLISLFTAIALGLLIVGLWPAGVKHIKEQALNSYGKSFAWGFLALFFTPIIILILLLSFVGIWAAVLLLMAWLIAIWVAKTMIMIVAGRLLIERYFKKFDDHPMIIMLTGVILSWIIFSIPGLGGLLSFLAIMLGLGAAVLHFKKA